MEVNFGCDKMISGEITLGLQGPTTFSYLMMASITCGLVFQSNSERKRDTGRLKPYQKSLAQREAPATDLVD